MPSCFLLPLPDEGEGWGEGVAEEHALRCLRNFRGSGTQETSGFHAG